MAIAKRKDGGPFSPLCLVNGVFLCVYRIDFKTICYVMYFIYRGLLINVRDIIVQYYIIEKFCMLYSIVHIKIAAYAIS